MHHTSWQQARQLLHRAGASQKASEEEIPLGQALGRILAREASTLLPVPHYDSSAMDGYATAGPPPWQLLACPAAAEGENLHQRALPLAPGQASPILTGGLIPAGTDAVIRQEQALLEGSILSPDPRVFGRGYPAAGADIRRAGEELPAGSCVLPAGRLLGARQLAALATLGFDSLTVLARPTVAIAYTGNEIISSGLPGPGQVRDAYSLAFPSLITSFGAQLIETCRLPDSPRQLSSWISSCSADLLLVTGGSSASSSDWLRPVLLEKKADYLFESVAVRPGHPALAAYLPQPSSAPRLLLGLPGNPLAAFSALYSYLPAYLRGRLGLDLADLPRGRLLTPLGPGRGSDLRLQPASLEAGPEGLTLSLLPRHQSHMLSSFASAQALALLPASGASSGQLLPYLPLDAPF
ncbi:MAG: molybdopterin molybdotransferase MoeA [Rothia sp. (in: high G+C Gram-positive bacteria)]|nr:molybdopterin molybdotransferase MoeA [Rothia sp. (in: high G+C Gram-positive bacteria)]